jgi:hypothetical protein
LFDILMTTELVDGEEILCQYVEQSIYSPSTSSVVINISNKVPPPRQPVLWSSICRTKYLLPVNQFCWLTGRGYFVWHIDDHRTGWRGGGTLFDILMTTDLVDGEVILCTTYW